MNEVVGNCSLCLKFGQKMVALSAKFGTKPIIFRPSAIVSRIGVIVVGVVMGPPPPWLADPPKVAHDDAGSLM